MLDKFTKRVSNFTIGTLISRIAGLGRESIFAYLFGAGFATDAFQVAFRIPNLLRDLFAESALSAAFVPTFIDNLSHREREEVWKFASNMLNVMIIIIGGITIFGILFAPYIVKIIAYGFGAEPGKQELTTVLTRIMFPFLLFVALAAWTMGILNAFQHFFIPAIAPAFFNVFSILIPIITYQYFVSRHTEPILGMAYGVTVGAIFQFGVQLPLLFKKGFRYHFYINFRDKQLQKVFLLWLPTILGFAAYQINFAVNTFLVTFLAERSITWLNYAYRIMHLPAGLFGVAIGSVAVAEFATRVSQNSIQSLKERLYHALKLVSLLTMPIATLFLVLALPICRVIYQRGRFTPEDTLFTAQALMLYAPGIFASAGVRSIAAGFYALKDTKTPALVGLGTVIVNFIINRSLMWVIGYRTFPIATSVCAFINFGVLFYLLRRKIGYLAGRKIFALMGKSLFFSIIGGATCYILYKLLASHHFLIISDFLYTLIIMIIAGGIGILIFYVLCKIFILKAETK
ncbi:MAG: murein biosynthesis integral membrane protein MurJ [candidate division WOR-3 bacterium]|nr:murein biosynthesis integral membrane protein MurJ [candidate division WOR-3 bacterium]